MFIKVFAFWKAKGTFVKSQLTYCSLIWMFHSRYINDKISKWHEHALRIVLYVYESTFDQLLEKDHTFSMHHQNFQRHMIKIYKANNNISGFTLDEFIFVRKENGLNLRSQPDLFIPSVTTLRRGKTALRHYGTMIWNSLPIYKKWWVSCNV